MNHQEPKPLVKFKSPESSFDLKKIVQYFLMAVGLFTCLCTAFFVFIIILIVSLSSDQADKKTETVITEQFPLQ